MQYNPALALTIIVWTVSYHALLVCLSGLQSAVHSYHTVLLVNFLGPTPVMYFETSSRQSPAALATKGGGTCELRVCNANWPTLIGSLQ